MKKAIITGVTGQDGSILAEHLLSKDYEVIGIVNPSGHLNDSNIRNIKNSIKLYSFDIVDIKSMRECMSKEKPDEIYNFAGQSSSVESNKDPLKTGYVNGLAVVNILELIKSIHPETRMFQASSSEMFGQFPLESPQSEETPFKPENPYSIAKLYAHQMVQYYRLNNRIFACSGILYNHESTRRKQGFLTKKIIQSVVAIKKGIDHNLVLGNLNAIRDWGSAEDYVRAAHLILQAKEAKDYVIATGIKHSVKEFIEKAFAIIEIKIDWHDTGLHEVGVDQLTGRVLIRTSSEFYREEKKILLGNPQKIVQEIGWKPIISFDDLIKSMVEEELKHAIL